MLSYFSSYDIEFNSFFTRGESTGCSMGNVQAELETQSFSLPIGQEKGVLTGLMGASEAG